MGFVVEALGRNGSGSRESAQIVERGQLETRLAPAAVRWTWIMMTTSRRTACDFEYSGVLTI